MATERLPARPGVFAQLRRGLMLADTGRAAEDTTGPIVRAWWRVAIRPTPATFHAWGRRAGPRWIVTSLLAGCVAVGLSAAIGALYDSRVVTLQLNAQGHYLIHATVGHVLARAVATAVSLLPITLAVLVALAIVTRPRQAGGLRTQWDALLPAWAIAHPALGFAVLVNSTCSLGLAEILQQLHVTASTFPPGIAYTVLSIALSLVLVWMVLGYMFGLFSSAVQSVIPQPVAPLGCLAVAVYLAVGLLVGFALTSAAQALGIPGPLFG